jgi:hypothetical protein
VRTDDGPRHDHNRVIGVRLAQRSVSFSDTTARVGHIIHVRITVKGKMQWSQFHYHISPIRAQPKVLYHDVQPLHSPSIVFVQENFSLPCERAGSSEMRMSGSSYTTLCSCSSSLTNSQSLSSVYFSCTSGSSASASASSS